MPIGIYLPACLLALVLALPALAADPCDQQGDDPIYKCLSERLAADFFRDPSYVSVPPQTDSPPPILDPFDDLKSYPPDERLGIQFDGLPWYEDSVAPAIIAAFPQEEYVRLPEGSSIRVHWGLTLSKFAGPDNPQPVIWRRIWDYPVGTEIVHRLSARVPDGNGGERLKFVELRVLRHLPGGRWAGGAYVEDPADPKFVVLRKSIEHPVELDVVRSPPRSVPIAVARAKYFPVGAKSCRHCHFQHGSVSPQVDVTLPAEQRIQLVGPCDFGFDTDSRRLRPWIEAFQDRFGRSPLIDDP